MSYTPTPYLRPHTLDPHTLQPHIWDNIPRIHLTPTPKPRTLCTITQIAIPSEPIPQTPYPIPLVSKPRRPPIGEMFTGNFVKRRRLLPDPVDTVRGRVFLSFSVPQLPVPNLNRKSYQNNAAKPSFGHFYRKFLYNYEFKKWKALQPMLGAPAIVEVHGMLAVSALQ